MKEKGVTVVGRDYSKPMVLNLHGTEGFRKFVKLATSPSANYNAKEEAQKAADNLRKQGLSL